MKNLITPHAPAPKPLLSIGLRVVIGFVAVAFVAGAAGYAGHESGDTVTNTMAALNATRIHLETVTIVAHRDGAEDVASAALLPAYGF